MRSLKRITLLALATFTLSSSLSSCATLFGGPVTDYQKRKPGPGEPQREVRAAALIADILLFFPGAIVDFATGAIYKPKPGATSLQIPFTQPQPVAVNQTN